MVFQHFLFIFLSDLLIVLLIFMMVHDRPAFSRSFVFGSLFSLQKQLYMFYISYQNVLPVNLDILIIYKTKTFNGHEKFGRRLEKKKY